MNHRIATTAAGMAAMTLAALGAGAGAAQAAPHNPNPGCFQIRNLTNGTLNVKDQTGGFNFPRALGAGMTTQPSCAKANDHVTYAESGGLSFTLRVNPDGNDGTITASGKSTSYFAGNVAVFRH